MKQYFYIPIPIISQDLLIIKGFKNIGKAIVDHLVKHKWMTEEYSKGCDEALNELYYCEDSNGIAFMPSIQYEEGKRVRIACIVVEEYDVPVLLHETVHIAWQVLDESGINISKNNHEILAYLIQYISKIIWSEVEKTQKGK